MANCQKEKAGYPQKSRQSKITLSPYEYGLFMLFIDEMSGMFGTWEIGVKKFIPRLAHEMVEILKV